MKLKAILFIFFFNILIYPALYGMDKEIVETVQIIAEMCCRKKVDLKNKTFEFSKKDYRGRTAPFTLADYDADNVFETTEWKIVYPKGLKRLVELWGNADICKAEEEFDRDIDLFGLIEKLQSNSKKMLLKNLSKYTCSSTKFIINSFLSLTSCSCAALSSYLFFNTENQKLKLASAVSGLASFVGTMYFAKNAKKVWDNYSWWNGCANFQKAMNLCKRVPKSQ